MWHCNLTLLTWMLSHCQANTAGIKPSSQSNLTHKYAKYSNISKANCLSSRNSSLCICLLLIARSSIVGKIFALSTSLVWQGIPPFRIIITSVIALWPFLDDYSRFVTVLKYEFITIWHLDKWTFKRFLTLVRKVTVEWSSLI